MWFAILGTAMLFTVVGMIYLVSRFAEFGIVRKIAGERRWLRVLLGIVPMLGFVIYGCFDTINMMVVLLHLVIFWIIADIVCGIVSRIRRRKGETAETDDGEPTGFRVYRRGIAVIALCAVYLTVGWFNAHNVDRALYELTTDKELPGGSLRIAHIADSHIGTTFDGEGFGEYLETIEAENPDLLVVTGDFIDDNTSREEMLAACRQFSRISTTYGIYFVYGNHDKGYGRHGYDVNELEAELTANGVTVLEDDVVFIGDSVCVIGRMDRNARGRGDSSSEDSRKGRMSMGEITQDIAPDTYSIVLDHQPNDYDAQAEAGVDLVLSGHTHGGQLIPLGPIGRLIGANDRTYGIEHRDNTDFIVTSGISDWEIDFKTGTKSEYVIIDITQENA